MLGVLGVLGLLALGADMLALDADMLELSCLLLKSKFQTATVYICLSLAPRELAKGLPRRREGQQWSLLQHNKTPFRPLQGIVLFKNSW